MNTKRFFAAPFLLAALLLTACGNEVDRTDPVAVADAWMRAMMVSQDEELAASYVIPSQREDFRNVWRSSQDEIPDMSPMPEELELSVSIDERRAKVEVENWDEAAGGINLEMENGSWWVVK